VAGRDHLQHPAYRSGHLITGSAASYWAKCLKYAQALYSFALQYPGIGYSGGFRNSSGDCTGFLGNIANHRLGR
jgi:hypothetical protein